MKIKQVVHTIKTALRPQQEQRPALSNPGLTMRTRVRAGMMTGFGSYTPDPELMQAIANGTLFKP